MKIKKVIHSLFLVTMLTLTVAFIYGCSRGALVTFHTYGGTEIKQQRISSLDEIADPVKEGFEFDGWYRYSNFGGGKVLELPNEKQVALHAKWIAIEYTVNYYLNGGEGLESSTFTIDSEKDLQVPVKEGYEFSGWYLSSDLTGDMVSKIVKGTKGDLTLYACWTEVSTSGIRYELVESQDGYRVIGLNDAVEHLIIPSTHQGLPVVELLFKGSISSSVRSTLKSISLPSSIVRIENIAHPLVSLAYFNNLTDINVSPNNELFASVDGVLFSKDQKTLYSYPAGKTPESYLVSDLVEVIYDHAFFGNRFLKTIEISSSVKTIGDFAFAYNFALENVLFLNESNLESIGTSAFLQAWKLGSLTIPASVTEIKDEAFGYMLSLTEINVLEDNAFYQSVDGVLFSKDLTELIKYPARKADLEYVIPQEVVTINSLAIENAFHLTKVTISKNVEMISKQAFYGANQLVEVTFEENSRLKKIDAESFFGTNLTEVILPASLESIGNAAFRSNANLKSVTILSEALVTLGAEGLDFTHVDLKIYVLEDLVAAYKDAANWKTHKDKITSII